MFSTPSFSITISMHVLIDKGQIAQNDERWKHLGKYCFRLTIESTVPGSVGIMKCDESGALTLAISNCLLVSNCYNRSLIAWSTRNHKNHTDHKDHGKHGNQRHRRNRRNQENQRIQRNQRNQGNHGNQENQIFKGIKGIIGIEGIKEIM